MSNPPDFHLGDSDGEDELSDQEPHELVTDQDVAEAPEKENSNRQVREKFTLSNREEGTEVSHLQWNVV